MVPRKNDSAGKGCPDRSSLGRTEVHSPMGGSRLLVQNPPPPVGTCHDTVHRPDKRKPPFPGQGGRGKSFAHGFPLLGDPGQDIRRGRHHALRKSQVILPVLHRGHPDGKGYPATGSIGIDGHLHGVEAGLHLPRLGTEQAEGDIVIVPQGHIERNVPPLPLH